MKLIAKSMLAGVLIASFFAYSTDHAQAVTAADWRPGRIIDDVVFQNKSAMSVVQIQQFLDSKVPTCDRWGTQSMWSGGPSRAQWSLDNGKDPAPYTCLKEYVENPVTKANNASDPTIAVPGGLSAAQLIYNAAQAQNINPQVYLVLLQKEQSLVTDDWPYAKQFERATGNNCPDTAPCNPAYAWLWTQVNNAGAQFNYYVNNFDEYNYAPGWNNILYNPSSSCGTQSVFIENAYTAALYIYTPYVPNQAALNNMYGTGDSCSAYGNRNFWRMFNDWFGSSQWRYTYAQGNGGSAAQYLIFDGLKIPLTYDSLFSWNITGRLPLTTLQQSQIDAMPNYQGVLSNWVQGGDGTYYLVDSGKYYTTNISGMNAWGGVATAPLPTPFITELLQNSGQLTYGVASSVSPDIFIADGGVLRSVTSEANMHALLGQSPIITSISGSYFAVLPKSTAIPHPRLRSSLGQEYVVSGNKRYSVDSNYAGLLSFWSSTTVSDSTISRYQDAGSMNYLLRGSNTPTVYLLDGVGKKAIVSFEAFNDLRKNQSTYELLLPQSVVDMIPNSTGSITNSILTDGVNSYIMQRGLLTLGETSFAASGIATTVSPGLIMAMGASASAKNYVQPEGYPGVYLITAGKKHPIQSYSLFQTYGLPSFTKLSLANFSAIPNGPSASGFVRVGANNYLIDGNNAFLTSSDTEIAWGLVDPITADMSVLSGKAVTNLTRKIQRSNGEFCFVDSGAFRCAQQHAMIFVWQLHVDTVRPSESLLVSRGLSRAGALSQFVIGQSGSPYAGAVFLMDGETITGFATPESLNNLGYDNPSKLIVISGAYLSTRTNASNPVHPYLLSNSTAGQTWVIEAGQKRAIGATVLGLWTTGTTPSPVSPYLLDLYPTGSTINARSVTAISTPAIYAIADGGKYGITTYQKYINGGYAPYINISPLLLSLIPNLGVI